MNLEVSIQPQIDENMAKRIGKINRATEKDVAFVKNL